MDAYREQLVHKLARQKEELERLCSKISAIRQKEAKKLAGDMVKALTDLNFLEVKFEIQVRHKEEYAANGYDDVRIHDIYQSGRTNEESRQRSQRRRAVTVSCLPLRLYWHQETGFQL